MSEGPDKDQKTHDPTDKKLADARQKGDVALSSEMRHAVMFVGMLMVIGTMGAWAFTRLSQLMIGMWGGAADHAIDPRNAQSLFTGVASSVVVAMGPMMATLTGLALLTLFLQGRPNLSWSRVKPNFKKLAPWSGLARMFGPRAFVEFAKTLAKFGAVAIVCTTLLWPKVAGLERLVGAGPHEVGLVAGSLIRTMVKAVAMLAGAIALFDFIYQRRTYLAKMRMSLQEIKDEHKQSEGDPKIKGKIRQIQAQRARKRMMAAVPTASVIVTNPTHYSVALKYDHGAMNAPIVVAKGVDDVAFRIREVAKENGVPIVASPALARALFASVDIDHPIPTEHYAAVAEIIGYVMKLSRRSATA
ncbi:MAG: flagellar biosynthetic protein FlhB [Alphaproteobacteria bacterium]|nr:flagellar biosynthetic protein FlhB [Alphaproteobacteria bacterium]